MKYVVTVGGQEIEVTLDGPAVRAQDLVGVAHLAEVEGTSLRVVTVGDRVHCVVARHGPGAGQYTIRLGGFSFDVEALDERARAIRQLAGTAGRRTGPVSLSAPMPGLVVRVLVQLGDHVKAGQGVVVIEAMKMENELRASMPGVVRAIAVTPGSAVEKGAVLVEFDPAA